MREQAAALTEKTGGVLVGEVITSPRGGGTDDIDIRLSIKVPALNNYVYRVLSYQQPVELYRGYLFLGPKNSQHQVANEKEFIALLRRILSSEEVTRTVNALWAQARELAEPDFETPL